jgi:hypothetical protein
MERKFQFVDNGAPLDGITRKSMRSHVMKGRNAGKTLQRRSRLGLGVSGTKRHDFQTLSKDETATMHNLAISRPVERNLGNVLHTFHFPIELNDSSVRSILQCKHDYFSINDWTLVG